MEQGPEDMELKGKAAVITGAASGIGLATCQALVRDELAGIAAVDRSESVFQVCAGLNRQAERELALPFVGDVTSASFRRQVFDDMKKRFGVVQLCIPAAGITRDRLAVKVDRATGRADLYPQEDFEAVLQINLVAPIYWAMETVASVAEDRARRGLGQWEPSERTQGSIVLIGSVSSAGNKGQVSYATAKRGLEGAQRTLATEAIYHGVRCAIIHPGYTDTPMVQVLGEQFIHDHILPHTQLRRLLRNAAVSGSLWVDAGWHPAA